MEKAMEAQYRGAAEESQILIQIELAVDAE